MEFPKLIPQSSNLQQIPNPEDFGLDSLINTMFFHEQFTDFTEDKMNSVEGIPPSEKGRVVDYARNVLFHLETKPKHIRTRQELLTAFMDAPDLVEFIKEKTICPLERANMDSFSLRAQRGQELVSYLFGLTQRLPDVLPLDEYKMSVEDACSSERIESLMEALDDIDSDGELEINVRFDIDRYGKNAESELKLTFSSGKDTSYQEDHSSLSFGANTSILDYDSLRSRAIEEVKASTGLDLSEKLIPTPIDLNLRVEEGKISGTVTYHKLKLIKSAFSRRRQFKSKTVSFEWEETELRNFNQARNFLKKERFLNFLKSFDEELKAFSGAVVELRYLASMADYFIRVREKVPASLPKIAPMGSKTTQITDLIEPNLLGKVEEPVANDVSVEKDSNLFAITGSNNNGKTTYMNSLGIAQTLFQAGGMILSPEATMSPKDNIFTHYIRPGDISTGESRYAHGLSRIKTIFQEATEYSLVLMDESCSGTSPQDGSQQADVVFRALGTLGATSYFTTHFHNLIATAKELPYAKNLCCVTKGDQDDLVYTFKIVEGSSHQSNGLYLAKQIGVDESGLVGILTKRSSNGLTLRTTEIH